MASRPPQSPGGPLSRGAAARYNRHVRETPAKVLTIALLLAATVSTRVALAAADPSEDLAGAQRLIDAGQPAQAVHLLAKARSAQGLLLRSTAALMAGDEKTGKRDLDKALAADPALRQAWLNRAALAIAEQRYDAAWSDLWRAQEIDPRATDNDINLGVVELLRGKLQEAAERFATYVERVPTADAHYLVATNYGQAGYAALAAESLRRAIALDERTRARARTDPNFAALLQARAMADLLAQDDYRPAAGSLVASQTYGSRYESDEARMVRAVLDALLHLGEPADPVVEATESWAILWSGRLRLKVEPAPDPAASLVTVVAPPAFEPAALWQARTTRLFRQIAVELAKARR
jgi:tetratricopeptide (TPR) repeat protein